MAPSLKVVISSTAALSVVFSSFVPVAVANTTPIVTFSAIDIAQAADDKLRREALLESTTAARKGDFAGAAEALEPLAEDGDAIAQFSLGVLLSTGGKGLQQDYAKAMMWFKKAADQRNASAMRQIAIAHEKGLGVPASPAMAQEWYLRAADRGDAMAQLTLGIRRANGEGMPADNVQAYKWLTLASNGIFFDFEKENRAESEKNLKIVTAKLSPPERVTAEKLTREWSAK